MEWIPRQGFKSNKSARPAYTKSCAFPSTRVMCTRGLLACVGSPRLGVPTEFTTTAVICIMSRDSTRTAVVQKVDGLYRYVLPPADKVPCRVGGRCASELGRVS